MPLAAVVMVDLLASPETVLARMVGATCRFCAAQPDMSARREPSILNDGV